MLALVAFSLKPVKLLGPRKWTQCSLLANNTQHCWPTTPNIVGPNNVVTCCVHLHATTTMLALVAFSLKPVKLLGPRKWTRCSLLANNTQHCWPTTPNIVGPNNVVTCCVHLHGTTTMLALVAFSLKPVKLLGPRKWTQCSLLANNTQHCWAQQCCDLLRPFAWNHNNVGTCCVQFETGQTFRPTQMDAVFIVGQQHPTLLGPTML